MRKIGVLLIVSLISLTACMNNTSQEREDEQQNVNTRQISDEAKGNEEKKYFDSDEKGVSEKGTKRDIFATEEALEITQLLKKRMDTKDARVATTDDRVVVSVKLDDPEKTTEEFSREVRPDVQVLAPDKDIVIYTDEYEWNQMKDFQASVKQKQLGENIEYYIEKYFPIEIKD